MKVSAITFDFWGTLCAEGPDYTGKVKDMRNEILADAASEAGVPAEPDKVLEAWRLAALDFDTAWNAGQSMPPFERVTRMFKYLGLPYDQGQIAETTKRIVDAALEGNLILLPGVKEAVPQLAKEYVLGIVSDTGVSTGRILREQLRRHGLLEYFTGFSWSDETGTVKPHREAFMTALDQMAAEPQHALHIGDIHRTDIAGAFAAGYPYAVLYTGHTHRSGTPEPSARIGNHSELANLIQNVFGSTRKAL